MCLCVYGRGRGCTQVLTSCQELVLDGETSLIVREEGRGPSAAHVFYSRSPQSLSLPRSHHTHTHAHTHTHTRTQSSWRRTRPWPPCCATCSPPCWAPTWTACEPGCTPQPPWRPPASLQPPPPLNHSQARRRVGGVNMGRCTERRGEGEEGAKETGCTEGRWARHPPHFCAARCHGSWWWRGGSRGCWLRCSPR